MDTRRARGWQLVLLWMLVLSAFALALRRGTLVPWGSGAASSPLGAPPWALLPLGATLVVTTLLTLAWWRRRAA